jgi:hypothetical protein
MTGDRYIQSVIDLIPPGLPVRDQIAMELRAHIAERMAQPQPLDEIPLTTISHDAQRTLRTRSARTTIIQELWNLTCANAEGDGSRASPRDGCWLGWD